MKTIKQLAQEALDVQDACNLSGVIHSWSRAIGELWKHTEGVPRRGTAWVNLHPINQLWADKVASLTNTQTLGHDGVLRAYARVTELAQMEDDHECTRPETAAQHG